MHVALWKVEYQDKDRKDDSSWLFFYDQTILQLVNIYNNLTLIYTLITLCFFLSGSMEFSEDRAQEQAKDALLDTTSNRDWTWTHEL